MFNTKFFRFKMEIEMDQFLIRSPTYILHRRLSMRPSPEELEERNILKSEFGDKFE